MLLRAGTRVGPYEIVSALGAGGMGEVYRARDTRLERDVAVKVLSTPFVADAERLARLEREARALAALNHPGIAAIYGIEQASLGSGPPVPALILELVEGETLEDRIKRGPIVPSAALDIARRVADALDVAHERHIVHRDLKPANIKITGQGTVKVLDFGLAKVLASRDSETEREAMGRPTVPLSGTREGVVLGTAAYMSPEQARGQLVDKRTDIWAFGCVLYEMLTGTVAFSGESLPDTMVAVLQHEPDLSRVPASTPPNVRLLLRRCLQKDTTRRLRDIGDARMELEAALAQSGEADTAREAPAGRQSRRTGWLPIATAGAGLAGGLAIGVLVSQRSAPAGVPPTFDRVSRLVSTAAHEFGPVVSPDGKWVAYLSNARGPTDVWVKFIAGGDPINLTASTDVTVQAQDAIGGLAVSPDGTQIAFQAQAPQQLGASWVILAPLGGAPRRALPTGYSGLQWSSDGKRIAYVKTGGPLGDALLVADADGQHEVELVKRQGGWHVHWVRWDPGGRFVYFNRGVQNFNVEPTEIFRAPTAGGPIERVIATARRAVFPFPSPGQRGLYYAANPDGVDLGLWWRDLGSGRDYRVTLGVGEYTSPSVSADGRRLVGTVLDVRQSLARVVATFERPVALEPMTDGFTGDIDPSFSPDGTRLLFSSSRTGSRTLWTARGDLSQPAPLTTGPVIDEHPAWSPDGSQVAFVSDRGGRRGIWLIGAEGGTPRLVTSVDVLNTVSWSPDGRRLVLSAPVGDAPGLMTVDVATGATTRVPTAAAATAPAWAPHEDVIAYVEPHGGTTGAFTRFVRSDGRVVYDPQDPLGKLQVSNGFLAWSPDGRRLAALALPGAFGASIWIAEPASASPPRKLLDLPGNAFFRGLSWSRDGSSIVLGQIQQSGDIFLAERVERP